MAWRKKYQQKRSKSVCEIGVADQTRRSPEIDLEFLSPDSNIHSRSKERGISKEGVKGANK
jgi:hypothetical protein